MHLTPRLAQGRFQIFRYHGLMVPVAPVLICNNMKTILSLALLAATIAVTPASAANHPPTVAIGNTIYVSKNTAFPISYNLLKQLTGAGDIDGDTVSFVVTSIENGSVIVNNLPVTVGETQIAAGDTLTWAPPQDIYNSFAAAFEVKAFDGQEWSETATMISASIAGNNPPELTFVDAFDRDSHLNGHKNEPLRLTFSAMKQASDLRDLDDNDVTFAVDSVVSGTLAIDGQPVLSRTAFGPTNVLTWLPPTNSVGTFTAFKVLGFDGVDYSAALVAVQIQVTDPTPKFVKGANQTVLRDDFGQTVWNWATGIGPDEYALHFEVTNDNPSLFLSQPEILDDGTLSYVVEQGAYGKANVTVVLADDQGHRSAPQMFTITVLLVNYAPEFELTESLTVAEDAGVQKIAGFASGITAGDGEAMQTVSFLISVTNAALYSVKPTLSTNGLLTFKTATNAFGDDFVTVTLKDNGTTLNGGQNSTTKTFVLHVTPVNDAPILTFAPLTMNEDATGSFVLKISDVDDAASEIKVELQDYDHAFIAAAEVVSDQSLCALNVVPVRDAFGKTSVTLSVSDKSSTTIYHVPVTILPVNDMPSFELQSDIATVTAFGQVTTISNFAARISTGAANETNQAVTFDIAVADATFFSTKPSIAVNGTLRFKVADNLTGSNLVTVIARDNGGVANGGINQSAAKYFYVVAPKNPFPDLKGVYVGLFYEASGVSHHSSGYFTATLNDKGAYTGKVQIEGGTYGFAGQFGADGKSSLSVVRLGKTALKLNLSAVESTIVGTIASGDWIADVKADKAPYSITNIAPQLGKYTVRLNDAGVATMTVSAAGGAVLAGSLNDGVAISGSGFVTKSGQLPVYISLYSGKGSMLGWVTFTNREASDLEATFSWIRYATNTLGAGGFTNEVSAVGSMFITPATGQPVIKTLANTVTLAGGGLAAELTPSAMLNLNNVFTCYGNGLALKVNLQTGLLSGSFLHPVTKLATPLKGIVDQKNDSFGGFFVSRGIAGTFDSSAK